MSSAWIVGEVLVDLIPSLDGDEVIDGIRYRAVVGGGPANTAKALARLGRECAFIGGLSSDRFGHMAWMELERDGVGLDFALESDQPTAKAILSIGEDGSASYRFDVDRSVTFDFNSTWLPDGLPDAIHVGTLATVIEPGSSEIFAWVEEKRDQGALILFDPNVRSAYLSDRASYRAVVEKWLGISDVVKASSEDIGWLYPERSEDAVVEKWSGMGVKLVVVTYGGNGMVGYVEGSKVSLPGIEVSLVDTVGAGDTVGAVLLEAMVEEGLDSLLRGNLHSVLRRASVAAAITCSRQGANPPTLKELNEFFDSAKKGS
ncbi:MAG: carbohydrate kinase family protein [Candidatus Nanopelagicaceae bacterium]